jgi:hypothetical protein
LVFVDRNVDEKTGTIRLEASFPNPGGIIRPGQYAKVRAAVSVKKGAVLAQQGSLMEMQGISSVAVVKADDTVEMRVVKPAERIGALVILDSGVKPGERIIVEGMQRVRAGVKVQPQAVRSKRPRPRRPPLLLRGLSMADFFIRRPTVAIVIAILIVLLGAAEGALDRAVSFLAPPTIRVTANYPGASALNVEQSVATPVEQEVSGVENMIYMKSSNTSDGRIRST